MLIRVDLIVCITKDNHSDDDVVIGERAVMFQSWDNYPVGRILIFFYVHRYQIL